MLQKITLELDKSLGEDFSMAMHKVDKIFQRQLCQLTHRSKDHWTAVVTVVMFDFKWQYAASLLSRRYEEPGSNAPNRSSTIRIN